MKYLTAFFAVLIGYYFVPLALQGGEGSALHEGLGSLGRGITILVSCVFCVAIGAIPAMFIRSMFARKTDARQV